LKDLEQKRRKPSKSSTAEAKIKTFKNGGVPVCEDPAIPGKRWVDMFLSRRNQIGIVSAVA